MFRIQRSQHVHSMVRACVVCAVCTLDRSAVDRVVASLRFTMADGVHEAGERGGVVCPLCLRFQKLICFFPLTAT